MKRAMLLLLLAVVAFARLDYERDDFQSFFCARRISGIAMNERYIFYTTEFGVYRYDWIYGQWKIPFTYFDVLFEDPRETLPDNRFSGSWRTEIDPFRERHGREFYSLPDDIRWGYECQKTDFAHIVPPFGFFFNYGEMAFMDELTNRYPVTSCIDAGSRNIWVGTDGAGIFHLDKNTHMARREVVGLGSPSATAILATEDAVFFGGVEEYLGYAPAITRWDREGSWMWFSADSIPWIPDTRATCFLMHGDTLFAGTPTGVLLLDSRDLKPHKFISHRDNLYGDSVTAMEISDGFLYVGTDAGLNRLKLSTLNVERMDKPVFERIAGIEKGQADTLWIGSEYGVYALTDDGFGRYDADQALTATTLDRIGYDQFTDRAWFTSQNIIVMQDDIPWDGINYGYHGPFNDIETSKRYEWFGTEQGVLRFRKDDETFMWYGMDWGLIDNRIRTVEMDGSYVWLGTPRGATRFHWYNPSRIDY